MTARIIHFDVTDGEIRASAAGWVYVWSDPSASNGQVAVYVGATSLHPAARAEKHLRDVNPEIGRIRARYPAAGGSLKAALKVHAVEIGSYGRRAHVKDHVAWLLKENGLLSPHYCGEAPEAPTEPLTPSEEACALALVTAVSSPFGWDGVSSN